MERPTIAVIGARELGCRIALFAVHAGCRVILEDVSPEVLDRAVAWVTRLPDDAVRRDPSFKKLEMISTLLRTARSAEEACREADIIIETVADEEELKLELYTIFDRFAKPGAILASTATTVSIDDLADMTFCADRCVGMRFCAGAAAPRRMELIRGRATSNETVARCREFARLLGMEVGIVESLTVPPASGTS
ncbi:MAG TPA: 3-hydroxyacyl-CoA dehydrogenase NAD-binding domain-containing protein [Candidatus Acidoferrum sp.]|nr:3-hydroxyacyl-CoA dehydrogenase NAD-binding domain-containing protein [Candidatus Acidoferrum sp.]